MLTELELHKKRMYKKSLRSHAHGSWATAGATYDSPPVDEKRSLPPGSAAKRKSLLSACKTLVKNIFTRRKV